jgi:hypothetical protein
MTAFHGDAKLVLGALRMRLTMAGAVVALAVIVTMVVVVIAVRLGRFGLSVQECLHQGIYVERGVASTNGNLRGLQVGDGATSNSADNQDIDSLFAQIGSKSAGMLAQKRKVVPADDLAAGSVDFKNGETSGLPEVRGELVSDQGKGDLLGGRWGHEDS